MKYLPLYYEWMRTGKIPTWGLCSFFEDDELFKLIDPENGKGITYWGYEEAPICRIDCGDPDFWERQYYAFTPLRQTVVLLMAAMNNEL